jgi:acyl-[acyl-carrier-protein]-phospholipid O-acyltransferase/long-chain-fatty-acid--[acyl-carrier-protein] ligase
VSNPPEIARPETANLKAVNSADAPPVATLSGFWALIAVQFQNAFSDNALKWLVSFLVLEAAPTKQQRDFWFILVVPLLFAVPFLLFSIPGGFFADKYSKRDVTLGTKLFELIVMGLATLALARNRFDLAGIALFLACTQGALFGPTKYALLPELLPESKLSWGNGVIEFTTLLSAIFAALAGGFLATHFRGRQVWSGVVFLTLTLIGLLISLRIPRLLAGDPTRRFDWNVPREFFAQFRHIRRDSTLAVAILANTFFWFLGSLLLLNIVLYATDILRVDEAHSSYLLAALSLGIGIGSFIAGYASGGRIEHGMVLPGMLGIITMAVFLSRPGLSFPSVATLLSFLGIAGGFFVVPVNALIQRRPALEQYAMLGFGHPDPCRVFLLSAVMTLLMGLVLIRMMPDLGTRALDWTRLRPRATL